MSDIQYALRQEKELSHTAEHFYYQEIGATLRKYNRIWASYFSGRREKFDHNYNDYGYWILFTKLFLNPGQKKNDIKRFVTDRTFVSDTTAIRMIGKAESDNLIMGIKGEKIIEYAEKEIMIWPSQKKSRRVYYYLSEELYEHCESYFLSIAADTRRFFQSREK